MSFFSKLVSDYRKGEKNFERARSAESRKDMDKARACFAASVDAFERHFAEKRSAGKEIRTPHLVMAGMGLTRLGRFEDALAVLDEAIRHKPVPDALLHAGYAAAKLGRADAVLGYWQDYLSHSDQRILMGTVKEQLAILRSEEYPDLNAACGAVAEAIYRQDKKNGQINTQRARRMAKSKRGY